MAITLSKLSILLGLLVVIPNLFGLMNPKEFTKRVRSFPRSTAWGYFLVLIATVWFMSNVKKESISDFESLKPYLLNLFLAVGIGTCIFVKDFIAVRGLAAIFLLAAKVMVDTARWNDSHWRLVIVTWAYVLVVMGVWFTISPWRMRDILLWKTATEQRVRVRSGFGLAFGLLLMILGLTVFRTA